MQPRSASRSSPAVRARRIVLACLWASNAINAGFLAFDERMWAPELVSGSALLAGALAYVVALPLVQWRKPSGFWLALIVAGPASIVVVGDNFLAFGSTPNLATYWLNWAFFAVQIPLVWGSARWIRSELPPQNSYEAPSPSKSGGPP